LTSTWGRTITEEYFRHLRKNKQLSCFKCGLNFKVGDELIRQKKRGGKSSPYHDECYRKMYQ